MRSGKLRHVITIQQLVNVQGSLGGESGAWEDVAEVRAEYVPLSSRELAAANQPVPEYTAMFRIRYRAGITEAMRIILGNEKYEIRTIINPGGLNRSLELMAWRLG